MRRILVALVFFGSLAGATAKHQTAGLNLGSDSLTFCMSGNCASLPDTSLFNDPVNDSIGKACIHNVRVSQLRHVPDLEHRLDALGKGKAIIVRNGRCSLTFPVIVGRRRDQVKKITKQAASKLRPEVLKMIGRLHSAVPDRPDLVFHLLWSRVLDEVWDKAWQAGFGHAPLPDITWAVFPQHPFTVGTYSYPLPGNGWLSLTQGPNSWQYKSTIVALAPDLHNLAWGRKIPTKDGVQLQELGMLDSAGNLRVFTYRSGEDIDQLFQQLISEYATLLAGVYDYKALAESFGITPERMFCMLLHETAYELLDDLQRSGDLRVPAVLTSGAEKDKMVELVSIRTADPE